VISRLGALGPVAFTLQLYLLCHYPIASWLRPERWWILGLSLVCAALTVATGFRNVLFGFVMITMVGAWCYYSWRSLFLPGFVLILMAVFVIGSDNGVINLPVNKLPLIAQRTLSFLPGDWDEDALESSASSNEFRKGIRDVYIKEYMSRSPLFGNGFDINKAEFDSLNDAYKGPGSQEDKAYIQSKLFIEGKLFHTGWISIYDIVGIVGSLAFLALAGYEILMAKSHIFGPKADRKSVLLPLYIWIFCNLVANMASFFLVFGDIRDTFVNLCAYGIVLSQLSDLENTEEIPIPRSNLKGPAETNPRSGVGSSYGYGYNSGRY
jgi:MFS family permease